METSGSELDPGGSERLDDADVARAVGDDVVSEGNIVVSLDVIVIDTLDVVETEVTGVGAVVEVVSKVIVRASVVVNVEAIYTVLPNKDVPL